MLFASDKETANVYMKVGMTMFSVIAIWFSGHLVDLFNTSVTDESQRVFGYVVISVVSLLFYLCA